MTIEFTKMQGLGNDFVVVDATRAPFTLDRAQIRALADRRFGVGCDQVLVVEPPRAAGADFRYRIFNADGGEVEQCGNGARCFVVFVRDRGLTTKREIRVDTAGGVIAPRLEDDGEVRVDMGTPRFVPQDIPLLLPEGDPYRIDLDCGRAEFGGVSMGNPHAVIEVADVDAAPLATLGNALSRDAHFPQGCNVGFVQVVDRAHVRLRVWERGAGATLACGTGACAAVAVLARRGKLDARVAVDLPGGTLQIDWPGGDSPLAMTGPAQFVFEGDYDA